MQKINRYFSKNRMIPIVFLSILFFNSCQPKIKRIEFTSFLFEPCMIVNSEQDNTIEGTYLTVKNFDINDSSMQFIIPNNFYINARNYSNWVLGWGSHKPLYDAGVENIRSIIKIDFKNSTIYLGGILRGQGFPQKNIRIVFWNRNPSGFENNRKKPLIDTKIWPAFIGQSVSFGAIEFDSILNKWVMIVNECDTNHIQIYAAFSHNLTDWYAANNGKPILTGADFKNCNWLNCTLSGHMPEVSDIIYFKNKWYLFMDGFSTNGKRHIGLAISEKTMLGPYKIYDNPILSPGEAGSWNDNACFYSKVKKYKDGFVMFYDGQNTKGYERIGMAKSKDLISWQNCITNPVIDQHAGWRSSISCSEPAYIEIRNDSILLMIAGVKKFKMGAWDHYITKKMYLDKSGNVDDTQLGTYLSTQGGENFTANCNNPIFTNDYTNPFENEHLGGNFKFIRTDSADFIIYQAKSSNSGYLHYNIMQRIKKRN